MNPELWAQFDAGHALEALCGQGKFFFPHHTYRTWHDDSFVLSQLCDWAADRGKVREASDAFMAALREHLVAERVDWVFSLVWAFMVSSVYQEMPFALDIPEIKELLDEAESMPGAAEGLVRFEESRAKVAKVRELLAKSDGLHFDVPRWKPPRPGS